MVGFPQDVEQIYFGENGILSVAKAGQTLVDMTTSKPSLAKKIGFAGEKIGAHVLDAPVSGGDIGAKNGTLTVMVGGQKNSFEAVKPIFAAFSQ